MKIRFRFLQFLSFLLLATCALPVNSLHAMNVINDKHKLYIETSDHKKTFSCRVCATTSPYSSVIINHVKTQHPTEYRGAAEFKCNDCPEIFTNLGSANKHQTRTRGHTYKQYNDTVKASINFLLNPDTNQTSISPLQKLWMIKKIDDKLQYHCLHCSHLPLSSECYAKKHSLAKHPIEFTLVYKICTTCDKYYMTSDFDKHICNVPKAKRQKLS